MPSQLMVPRDIVQGHPATPDAYLLVARQRAQKRGRTLVEDIRPLVAYVNHGRCIADCPHCGSGVSVDPEWPVAACLSAGCHRVYRAVILPDDWHELEAALAVRPMRNQNWGYQRGVSRNPFAPAESVPDLHRENDEHGVRGW